MQGFRTKLLGLEPCLYHLLAVVLWTRWFLNFIVLICDMGKVPVPASYSSFEAFK